MSKCVNCGRKTEAGGLLCTACAEQLVLSARVTETGQLIKATEEKGFVKNDSGKLQWSLLPFKELEDVVRVLMIGAKKYTPDNWKKCNDVTRYKDALMRHIISYICGDTTDDESGLSHLAHAVCNCLFLMYFDKTKKGE